MPAPGVMGSLTSLRLLSLDIDTGRLPAPAVDGLLAVLPQLHGLTQLHLTLALEQAPACLAALTRLHSLYLWGYWHQRPRVALPTGAWLHGLRRLVLPLPLLEDSLPALASAKGLERLGVLDAHGQVHNLRARLPSVLRWAARQPCLRLLVLELDAADLPARTLRTAQRQRSALCVECMEYADVHVRVFG